MPAQSTTDQLTFINHPARILIDGDDTEGRYGLVDMIDVPAGHMPPLHVHHSHDEGFFVLEGEVTLLMPGEEVTLTPGDAFVAPPRVPHTYRVGDRQARWLVTSRPAGFERFVAAVDALEQLEPERLAAAAADHSIEILGPPGKLP